MHMPTKTTLEPSRIFILITKTMSLSFYIQGSFSTSDELCLVERKCVRMSL